MNSKRTWLFLIGLALVTSIVVWLRSAKPGYAGFPPAATGPWVAFGDSLTEGYGASEGHGYPALLSSALGIEIINKGASGDTTADALKRLDDIVGLHPRVVLLCLGGNDGLNQVPKTQIFANLAAIIDHLQQDGTFVVLIGIRSASFRDKYGSDFKKLADAKHVLYVPDILKGIAFKPVYMSDAIHPNDEGYKRIADRLEKVLLPVLDKLNRFQKSAVSPSP